MHQTIVIVVFLETHWRLLLFHFGPGCHKVIVLVNVCTYIVDLERYVDLLSVILRLKVIREFFLYAFYMFLTAVVRLLLLNMLIISRCEEVTCLAILAHYHHVLSARDAHYIREFVLRTNVIDVLDATFHEGVDFPFRVLSRLLFRCGDAILLLQRSHLVFEVLSVEVSVQLLFL